MTAPRRSAPRRACGCRRSPRGPERLGDELLRRLAVGLVEQHVDLARLEAEPEQALARERQRIVRLRDHELVVRRLAGDLLAQLHDDPLRRALAYAGHGLEARRVAV